VARNHAGFTLIELLVSVAIVGILTAIAFPEFRAMIQNSRIQAMAHSILNGLQLARTEAIRRNLPVEFDLASSDVDAAAVTAIAPVATGQNWMVRVQDPVNGAIFVEGKTAQEGGLQHVQVAGVASITFNGLGATSMAAQAQYSLSNPDGGACAPAGPMHCLRVQVSPGGQARICDPVAVAGDNRRC
jgi:type IV fimbrial biogenesis protein FimT